jgi:hypothetical protein
MMTDDRDARVRRGAELLDRERPGWAAEVPADERLRMEECDECVLGHLYGEYLDGVRALFAPGVLAPFRNLGAAVVRHGFTCPGADIGDPEWGRLADAWRAEIRRRTEAGHE